MTYRRPRPVKHNRFVVRVIRRHSRGREGRKFRARCLDLHDNDKVLWERLLFSENRTDALREAFELERLFVLGRRWPERPPKYWKAWKSTAQDRVELWDAADKYREHRNTRSFKSVCKALKYWCPDVFYLDDLRQDNIDTLREKWAEKGLATSTINSYLAYLSAFINWCVDRGMWVLDTAPPRVKHKPAARRARAVTEEEYRKIREVSESYKDGEYTWLIDVVWLSNLRIGELRKVVWDWPGPIWPDLDHCCWRTSLTVGKTGKHEIFPMPPDFREWFISNWHREYDEDRFVFPRRRNFQQIVGKLGKKAGVVTGVYENGKLKYASAHDFRRALCCRWQPILRPDEMQRMMRHKSYNTTLTYYAEHDAETIARKMAQGLTYGRALEDYNQRWVTPTTTTPLLPS